MLKVLLGNCKLCLSRSSNAVTNPQGFSHFSEFFKKLTDLPTFNTFLSKRELSFIAVCHGNTEQQPTRENHIILRRCTVTNHKLHSFANNDSHYSLNCSYTTNTTSILQDQSVLQIRRSTRKKVPKVSEELETSQVDNVVAYAVAEEINLHTLENYLMKQGLYAVEPLPQDVSNVLHVRGKYNVEQKPKEIFVFEDGSVVFWCVPEVERGAFLKILTKFSEGSYASSQVLFEREEMDFIYVKEKSRLHGDTIEIKDPSALNSKQKFLEMYSFSNAMSQSVKLAIWESSLNKFVGSIENIIEDMRHGNKINVSRREILMKIGELFTLRHLVNLSSELLDTPDFYWDRESLEPLYRSLYFHLNISKRTRVMNEKIKHCCELTELVSSHLNDAHHTRLEWMIIILILVEVLFACARYIEKYLSSQPKHSKISSEQRLEPHYTQGDAESK